MSEYARWKGWEDAEFGVCPPTSARYFEWHVERAFAGVPPAGLRVAEVGFGNGRFLGYCREQGFDAAGVETDSELRARASASGVVAVATLAALLPHGPFDLLTAFDVLEHFERDEVEDFFAMLPRLLSPRAKVVIRVPNGDSPFGGRHQHGDITHRSTFGEFKFHQLAHASGLVVRAVGDTPWYVSEFEPAGFKMAVRGMTRAVLDYLLSMAYYNRRVDLGPNLVVVLEPVSPPAGEAAA